MLVLNADGSPINITSFRKGYKLIHKGKVEVLETEEVLVKSEKTSFKRPSIVQLRNYVVLPYKKIHLTRENVLKRDDYTCAYCSSKENLTLDHIIPRSRGGKNTWENLVTACFTCNHKKGDRLLEDTTMYLSIVPKAPTYYALYKY
jgi:5-methylcytosine-specific restriction endonuclease McrA